MRRGLHVGVAGGEQDVVGPVHRTDRRPDYPPAPIEEHVVRQPRMDRRAPRRVRIAAALLRRAARRIGAVEDELAALAPRIRPGDVCLDVGAKHGIYALMMAAATGARGRVVAFEPGPAPRRVIRAGRRALGSRRITIVPAAVADFVGVSELKVPKRRGLDVPGRGFLAAGTVGLGSNVEFLRHRAVPTTVMTLDSWCAEAGVEHVDVIKIDVEGGEAAVLAGARALIRRSLPTILVELEDRHLARARTTAAEVMATLTDIGYRAAVWTGGSWQPVTAPSTTQRNHLFEHPDRPSSSPT